MSNILYDITEDIDIKIKPSKTRFYFKWGIRIFISIVIISFFLGKTFVKYSNDIETIVNTQKTHENSINELKNDINKINKRIDKVYDDGYKEFVEYQKYNNEQLLLILEYGSKNKDVLKKIIEIKSKENAKKIEQMLNESKQNNKNK